MAKKVLVPIASGIEDIETACIIDVLRRAEADVTVASVGDLEIVASRNMKISADTSIKDCMDETYDLIALPGGLPGADNLRDSDELIRLLQEQKRSGRLYSAICASPAVVFAHHGLIDDRKATCYPTLQAKLPNPAPQEQTVVVDGNCVTSQGPGTAIVFALQLVEMLYSAEKADQIASAMLVSQS